MTSKVKGQHPNVVKIPPTTISGISYQKNFFYQKLHYRRIHPKEVKMSVNKKKKIILNIERLNAHVFVV